MTTVLLASLVVCAVFSIVSKDLLFGIIGLSAFSLISAAVFYVLRAPDVAITEAAVGTGVSTVIFLWAVRATERQDRTKDEDDT